MKAHTAERLAGALVLVLLGAFMLGLIATGTYWNYLNPKFM
jgi:cell division septation protein DedD